MTDLEQIQAALPKLSDAEFLILLSTMLEESYSYIGERFGEELYPIWEAFSKCYTRLDEATEYFDERQNAKDNEAFDHYKDYLAEGRP